MEKQRLDVAVVGGGTAGLYALAQAARSTDKVLLFEGGPLGTTCARVGCMPSKAFLHQADIAKPSFSSALLDFGKILTRVRELRDGLVEATVANTLNKYADKIVRRHARFTAPMVLSSGDEEYAFEGIVLATGSTPAIPPGWRLVPEKIVSTDSFFELASLPGRVLVVGMGPVGMELGQAMARMGIGVVMVEMTSSVAGIRSPEIKEVFTSVLAGQKGLKLYPRTSAALVDAGSSVRVSLKDLDSGAQREEDFGLVLLAAGRKPALQGLGLENSGLKLDRSGFPVPDRETLACEGQRVFLAGDASGLRPFFHDAAAQGTLAGANAAAKGGLSRLPEKVALNIVFTRPNICSVGEVPSGQANADTVTGTADCGSCGRAIVEENTKGRLCLYVNARTRAVVGAEMAVPQGEHLAHLLAAVIQGRFTLEALLSLPFYHPTYEEMILTAARDAKSRLRGRP